MKYLIRAGRHRALPPPVGIFKGRRSHKRSVVFTPSCRYRLDGEDMFDINKLYGIGYANPWGLLKGVLLNLVGIRNTAHHTDSARFGWTYDEVNDKIDLWAYCYVGGERLVDYLMGLQIGREYHVELYVGRACYFFGVYAPESVFATAKSVQIPYTHKKRWQYRLGAFFGGNQPAPHDMVIHQKNLPK